MYESPIELITSQIYNQMLTQIENNIFETIQGVVNVDKEELMRVLKYDRDQYEAGYRDGLNANKWISVEDRLPQQFGKYLVVCKSIDIAQIRLWEGMWDSLAEVTHWMPLPTPPQERED